MKLWKKTVFLMMATLLFSLFLVGGLTLYITGKNSLNNTAETYERQIRTSGKMMEQFWDNSKYERMTEVGKRSYLLFQFQACCGSGYALLKDRQVVENQTGYEIVNIEALDMEEMDFRIQRLAGKYLLLQKQSLKRPEGYMLLSVRDITENFREIKILAFWYLGIYSVIFLAAGAFICLMMRRMVLAMEKLQETAEKQELLLGALAHEMKTPLTSMIGYSDSLLNVKLEEAQKQRALEHINREGHRLERLSSKMLQLVGLYQNQSIEMTEVPVQKLLDRVSEMEREIADGQGISLRTECERFSVKMDEELMESLLLNLIDNALRASKPGDVVVIRAKTEKNRKLLQVEDQGCGIPEQEIEKVTDAFYMVDKSRSRRAGGAGLGLTLCMQIVRLHQGEMSIRSQEGKGTVVTVKFP